MPLINLDAGLKKRHLIQHLLRIVVLPLLEAALFIYLSTAGVFVFDSFPFGLGERSVGFR